MLNNGAGASPTPLRGPRRLGQLLTTLCTLYGSQHLRLATLASLLEAYRRRCQGQGLKG